MKFTKPFRKKKVAEVDSITSYSSWNRKMRNPTYMLRSLIFVGCLLLIIFFGHTLWFYVKASINAIGYQTVKVVSKSFGDPMQTDMNGNINVVLVGVGGEGHAGSYLADTVIIASFDPTLNTVSMISIPRDLFINYKGKYANKINALFAWKYNHVDLPENIDESMIHDYRIADSATALAEKASDISGLEIPYYALIDFAGFEELIDVLGGVEIDVPYAIHDTQYPGPNNTYKTFSIGAGPQVLDGETALKYARSRKTTSDFSRSQRQQLIIKAILKSLTETKNLTSVGTMKELYEQYQKIVTTNITARNAISMIDYAYYMPDVFTFGYTTECANNVWRTMKAGCVLYFPPRGEFEGMATMLPVGGNAGNVSNYDYTSYFAYIAAHNAGTFKEAPMVQILNGIDKDYASQYTYRNGVAGKTASKLRRYGIDVQDVDNDEEDRELTTITVYGTGTYQHTIDTLGLFIPTNNIEVGSGESKYNLVISLGNDYIDDIGDKPFNYYK